MFSVGEGRVARAYAPSLLRRRATRNSYDFGFKKQALFVLQMECHSLSFACDVNLSSLEQPLRLNFAAVKHVLTLPPQRKQSDFQRGKALTRLKVHISKREVTRQLGVYHYVICKLH